MEDVLAVGGEWQVMERLIEEELTGSRGVPVTVYDLPEPET